MKTHLLDLLKVQVEWGIDQAIAPYPVCKVGEDIRPLFKLADFRSNEKRMMSPIAPMPKSDSLSSVSSSHLKDVKSIEELYQALQAYEDCLLKKTALHTVFADGNPKASVMLVGEAPGADEDRQGKPFVGVSGQLLDKILLTIGLTRKNTYITNIIPWRPPGNRQPASEEIRLCLPFVQKHIELVKPEFLVCVGGIAAKSLLNTTEGITKLRGRDLTYCLENGHRIPVFALYHPAYLLRAPGQKKVVWQDILALKQRLIEKNLLKDNDGL